MRSNSNSLHQSEATAWATDLVGSLLKIRAYFLLNGSFRTVASVVSRNDELEIRQVESEEEEALSMQSEELESERFTDEERPDSEDESRKVDSDTGEDSLRQTAYFVDSTNSQSSRR